MTAKKPRVYRAKSVTVTIGGRRIDAKSVSVSKKASAKRSTKKMSDVAGVSEINGKKLYKVLSPTGESQNGGYLKWSLPDGDKPGEWHETPTVSICNSGLHLTTEPASWWKPGCRIFEVEASDFHMNSDGTPLFDTSDNKCAAKRVRLTRELADAELAPLGILRFGTHQIATGRVIAEGSATVRAWDSAKVEASGSATVRASGSATVRAWDSAKVEASGSATVRAWDSATVRAWDSAKVEASGSATVRAWDSAKVEACDSAIASIEKSYWNAKVEVNVTGDAVLVDRRGDGKPKITVGT